MAKTVLSDVLNPEILTDAIQGAFAQKNAFMGSPLVAAGVVIVEGQMPEGGPKAIGKEITVPYFGTLGEFVDNADGSSVTPSKIQQTSEKATVTRDSLAFEVSRWAQGNAAVNPMVGDPYVECARQAMEAATRAMDSRIVTAAVASGVLTLDKYSAPVPRTIDYDIIVDGKALWGDESEDVAGAIVHSRVKADMLKLKDSTGRPLLQLSQREGDFDRFCGVPILQSDRVPLTGSSMGAVTASGTTPPTVTLSGTPSGAWNLQIDIVAGGALGAATFRFSTDGGVTWSATLTTAASIALTDTAVDSLVGVNGKTGVTAAFASATYNADNLYVSNAVLKATTLLCQRGAMAFWYNRQALAVETDKDILAHTDIAAMHLYSVAHRYRRMRGRSKPGIVRLQHNVGGY